MEAEKMHKLAELWKRFIDQKVTAVQRRFNVSYIIRRRAAKNQVNFRLQLQLIAYTRDVEVMLASVAEW